jgi:large subunit ribosomal protein L9
MKVILLQDISKVGKKFDIKEVPAGYAQNVLIPKKQALSATPENIKFAEMNKEKIRIVKSQEEEQLRKNLKELESIELHIKAKVNEKGHLFKSIHAKEIETALKTELNISIEEKMIHLDSPLKEVGSFKVPIIAGNLKGSFTVTIESI